ncbi:MAG: hypothetical protein EBR82_72905 [Caulobacteraceae bacterium]|nr:hypothetical protein [Caulobacteraceae bacterium]
MKIGIFDLENGQIEREATAEEKKLRETEIAEWEKENEIKLAEEKAKAIKKQAILDRIGLTADELKTILG